MNYLWLSVSLAGFLTGFSANASEYCQDFTDKAEQLEPIYIDLADPVSVRVAEPLEADLLNAQVEGTSPGPLQKHYCRIGMFEMQLRFVQPLEDDAIAAIVTEAIYEWDAAQDPAGWVLTHMRRQPACARGDAVFTDQCP